MFAFFSLHKFLDNCYFLTISFAPSLSLTLPRLNDTMRAKAYQDAANRANKESNLELSLRSLEGY